MPTSSTVRPDAPPNPPVTHLDPAAEAAATAALVWMRRHPTLLVKLHDGHHWHTTPAAQDLIAWYVLIETHTDAAHSGIRITGAGPRAGGSHTIIGQPQTLSGDTATFDGGDIFRQLLTDAVGQALAEVTRAHRASIPSHRPSPLLARLARRIRRVARAQIGGAR